MRLLYEGPDGTRELSIAGGLPSSVGELAQVMGLPPSIDGLWIDDKWVAADRQLHETGLADGSVVGLRAGLGPDPPGWTLEVVGGLHAGERRPLPTDGLSLGRSPDADVTLAGAGLRPRHARIKRRDQQGFVQIGDEDPVAVEASTPLRLGDALIQVCDAPDDRPKTLSAVVDRTASGRVAFNRPPRPALPAAPELLAPPAKEPPRPSRTVAFGWAALAGPLLVGLLMAVFYSPYMALFALLSPLIMGATWLDNRRRDRLDRRRSQRSAQVSLAAFETAARAAHEATTRHRRDQCPHLAEAVRRIRQPSIRLWERRPGHDDCMSLVVAHGSQPFAAELSSANSEDIAAIVKRLGPLTDVPIAVDLGPDMLVGLVGPRGVTTAIARSLVVQAAAFHGPADLSIFVAADEVTAPVWAWTGWLPHTAFPALGRDRLFADHRAAATQIAAELVDAWNRRKAACWPQLLVVADGENLATGRTPPLRALLQGLAGPTSAIVLASSVDQLPATATAIIEVGEASGTVAVTQSTGTTDSALAAGMSLDLARNTARALARYEDPEQSGTGSGIPDQSSLFELLGLPIATDDHAGGISAAGSSADSSPLAEAIGWRWRQAQRTEGLAAVIGTDQHGALMVDLATDGPHALVGGTTGSGKSELLRTLVASLAATYSPQQVNFVLIDYKGGSAFDACAALPHVVGMVTDLDDRLAERALRCLEAELRWREQVMRDLGATDMAHYWSLTQSPLGPSSLTQSPLGQSGLPCSSVPLARLVVIIDEFAALAAELPSFMDSLVNVAQRGRSLGMHLVLATQRPAGAVSTNIRTNTALRIALRVLDTADSVDVLDSPEAASIGRHQPGRAFARFGPGEVVGFQCASVTGVTAPRQGFRIIPAPDGIPLPEPEPVLDEDALGDLARLAEAVSAAWDHVDGVALRRPWPDPLPEVVSLDSLKQGATETTEVAFALADDPFRQRQYPMVWDPRHGNALFAGNAGSGTTTALLSLAVALARRHRPDECHLYAIDSGSGQLAPLTALPHCGAIVGPDEQDRLRRLIRRLEGELDHRLGQGRAGPDTGSPQPLVVVLIDNWGGLVKSLDNVAEHTLLAALERVWAEGPAVGLCVAAAADQLSKVGRAIQAATPQTFVFRLGDPALYRQWGVAVDDPTSLPAGRGFAIPSGLELQVAIPDGGLANVVGALADAHPLADGPPPVLSLPAMVDPSRLDQACLSGSPWCLPLGLSDDTLAPVGLVLYPGEHALVLGPPRSGRTATLALLAKAAAAAEGRVVAFAQPGSPLAGCTGIFQTVADLDDLLSVATAGDGPTLVLIDDAESVADHDGRLKVLASNTSQGLHIVAAGRADRLRTAYGHWTAEIRFSRTGVLLQPTPLDGDLFTIQLPTRPTLPVIPGRGFLVQNGQPSVIQIAAPYPEDEIRAIL